MTLWSAGRYDAVGTRIAGIGARTVAAADARRPIRGSAVVDLACGTGNAALAAAAAGARVTGVDITPELIAIGADKARDGGFDVTWVSADAADTGLPEHTFDAAISNMGIIFVEPQRQLAELSRVVKPGATLAFSSWAPMSPNPLFDPVVAVLGAPPDAGFTPAQWGDHDIIATRLQAGFCDVTIEDGHLTWEFESLTDAVAFVCAESPMHVDLLERVDDSHREALVTAFESALSEHVNASGTVSFAAKYVVVTATAR
ncbi:class I SAM-dependent methyltransferase [soil metagenome]